MCVFIYLFYLFIMKNVLMVQQEERKKERKKNTLYYVMWTDVDCKFVFILKFSVSTLLIYIHTLILLNKNSDH